jgi:hypothetical protein
MKMTAKLWLRVSLATQGVSGAFISSPTLPKLLYCVHLRRMLTDCFF